MCIHRHYTHLPLQSRTDTPNPRSSAEKFLCQQTCVSLGSGEKPHESSAASMPNHPDLGPQLRRQSPFSFNFYSSFLFSSLPPAPPSLPTSLFAGLAKSQLITRFCSQLPSTHHTGLKLAWLVSPFLGHLHFYLS